MATCMIVHACMMPAGIAKVSLCDSYPFPTWRRTMLSSHVFRKVFSPFESLPTNTTIVWPVF